MKKLPKQKKHNSFRASPYKTSTTKPKGFKLKPNRVIRLGLLFILLFGAIATIRTVWQSVNKYKGIEFSDSLEVGEQKTELVEVTTIIVEKNDTQDSTIDFIAVLVWNNESSSGVLTIIPGWAYIEPSIALQEDFISIGDLDYIQTTFVPNDHQYMISEVENAIGLKVNNYIWLDSEARTVYERVFGAVPQNDNASVMFGTFIKNISLAKLVIENPSIQEIKVGIKTNLSAPEMYSTLDLVKKLYETEQLAVLDISDQGLTVNDLLASGTEIEVINYEALDKKLSEYYSIIRSRAVEKEQVKVEVFNASSKSGLASRVSRKVQNSGLTVVRSGNSPTDYASSTVYISSKAKFSNSLEVISELLKGHNVTVIEGRPEFLTTGDIIVVLGGDY